VINLVSILGLDSGLGFIIDHIILKVKKCVEIWRKLSFSVMGKCKEISKCKNCSTAYVITRNFRDYKVFLSLFLKKNNGKKLSSSIWLRSMYWAKYDPKRHKSQCLCLNNFVSLHNQVIYFKYTSS